MNRKLIFLDIDGTILVPGEGVRRTVREGLQTARDRGHQIFISTGRCCHMLPEELQAMELDGIVASAGSDIWVHGKNIYRESLSRELLNRAFGVLDSMESIYILEGFESIYVSKRGADILSGSMPVPDDNPEIVRWKSFFGRWKNTGNMDDWNPQQMPIPKISFMVWNRTDAERILRELGNDFYVAFFPSRSDHFFNGELISLYADKGTAVHRTAEYLGIRMEDTIAFGDSMNDYQMIMQAGCGVAMGNGDKKLKEAADRICETVEEDGVLRELERMGLI